MGSSIVPLWGSMGLSMGAVGFCGCYGAYGLTWSPLDLYGALYGRYGLLWVPWVDLVSFESLWGSTGLSMGAVVLAGGVLWLLRGLWVDLVSFGSLWSSMGLSMVAMGYYGSHGLTWSPLGLYGVPMVAMGPMG